MKKALYSLLFFLLSALSAGAQTSDCKQMHEVMKKETVYGISHRYGLTEEELLEANPILKTKGLKKGTFICIPYSTKEKEEAARIENERLEAERKAQEKANRKLKVAVILPFDLKNSERTQESLRMIDFYEGALLVIDSLKEAGVNVDVLTLDEGSSESSLISQTIQNESLKNVDLIIGPGRNENVETLVSYAQNNRIPLVVPFSNRKNLTNGRPYIFQANVHQSQHYSKVFSKFVSQNATSNIIFVGINDKKENADYIVAFKKALDDSSIKYKRITLTENDGEKLKALLDVSKKNVLIVSSSSNYGFDMVCASLNDLKLEEGMYDISIFGFPEWQMFASKNTHNMTQYKAAFFTGYYHNFVSTKTRNFCSQFETEFKHKQIQGFPSFGEMGHDIAAFFLTGIQKYGEDFIEKADKHRYNSIHMPFRFVHSGEQGGYVNSAFYMINYQSDGNIMLKEY